MSAGLDAVKKAFSDTYPIEREIGAGGMATVYLAHDEKHDRAVAVKVMSNTLSEAVGGAERFLREIRIVAGLQHPNILPLHDSGEVGGLLYYVTPFIEAGTLADRLKREGPLPVEEAVRITAEIGGKALSHAHDHGFVHRDVKPANIMFSGGQALLADFGVGRPVSEKKEESLTTAGVPIGTPSYMSPEQAAGEETIGPRSDVYSLGCVLYETLAGEPPHTGPSPQAILARSLTESPRPISSVRKVDPALEQTLHHALEPVAADRFSTAHEFVRELVEVTGGGRTGTPVQKPTRRGFFTLQRLAIAGIIAIVGSLGVIFGSGIGDGPTGTPADAFDRIVVLPFSLLGDESLSHLEQGVASLLSTVMDGVGDLRTVDPSAVMGIVAQRGPDFAAPEQSRSIVEQLGASRYVSGSIQQLGDRVTITAALNDVTRTPSEVDRWTVEGDLNVDLVQLVNGLTVRLLEGLGVDGTPQRLESITTQSPLALNEFLKAETAMEHGDYLGAAAAFERAVAVDSLFALGWYRLSSSLMFTQGSTGAVASAERAWRLADRLPDRDRRLAEALLATAESDGIKADRLYDSILADYPQDVEALYYRADVRLHFGPLEGIPMDSLGIEFDRVLYFDADHFEALQHRAWASSLDGELQALRPAVERIVDPDPQGYFAPVFQTMLAVAESDAAALEASTAELVDDFKRLLAVTMSSTVGDLATTEALAATAFSGPDVLPESRAFGHLVRAHQLAGLGRWQEALEQFGAAESLDRAAALEGRALLMLAPFAPVGRDELSALLVELENWDADNVPASISGNPWIVPHEGSHPWLRLYLMGGVHARLGDQAAALAYVEQLSVTDDLSADAWVRNSLARNLTASIAFVEGRASEGLQEMQKPALAGPGARTWERAYASPFFSKSLERYYTGEALATTGEAERAHQYFQTIWMSNAFDLAFLAPAHLARAELYDRDGDPRRALVHYRRFVELWQDADPELMERVDFARERINALEG